MKLGKMRSNHIAMTVMDIGKSNYISMRCIYVVIILRMMYNISKNSCCIDFRCVHLSSCTVDNGGDTFANLISERRGNFYPL